MAQGNKIVVSSPKRGITEEFILSGTPKPGTAMQIAATTEPVSNTFTCEVFNADADGDRRVVMVLLEDDLSGVNATTAFATGSRVKCYTPAAGEYLNMLVKNIAGTGDTFAIGDVLIIDDTTGKLIATTGDPESEPFIVMETKAAALLTDTLVYCKYTGQ